VQRYRNPLIALIVLAWIPVVLYLDHGIGGRGASMVEQRLLGVGTWVLLLALLVGERTRTRAQVAVVVVFATLVEYTFSYALHVYVYRLHDVPWFVPPGHGLVYLGALAIGRSQGVTLRAKWLLPLTFAVAVAYASWGLFISGRTDVLGALWCACLGFFLWRGRQPTVFIGAFIVVTYLELIGTHLGNWTWQTRDPILHLVPMGNPPSGAAGGYGFFDAAALLLAPLIESRLAARRRGLVAEQPEQLVVQPAVAAQHASAVAALDS
jgi:hypothetical protein